MAKAKFPGRPSKCHNRKRVLSSTFINYKDFDGFRAADDAYCRLSVFDFLFPEENEGSLFHGFSPHEIKNARESLAGAAKTKDTPSGTSTVGVDIRTTTSLHQAKKNHHRPSIKESAKIKRYSQNQTVDNRKTPLQTSAAVSGKFVLPTRSAHSSRVIKPNKRFLEPGSPERSAKKSRLGEMTVLNVSRCDDDVDDENFKKDGMNDAIENHSQDKPSPIVKFVLQKPKLKIKSESFSSVEGPFSSQSSHPPLDKLIEVDRPLTKVICGVCGSMWPYKRVKQARKFGIFSCNPCRRFIMKIVKSLEIKTIDTLPCLTNTGSCVIRQSTLGSCAQFSTEQNPLSTNLASRCQGCWLNLCLRSYRLPSELLKRLSKYLPPEIPDRPTVVSESKKAGLRSSDSNLNVAQVVLKNNFDKKEVKMEKEIPTSRASKGKIKLPLSGPRVKHVCRSASLVLGLPTIATFDEKGSVHSNGSDASFEERDVGLEKSIEILPSGHSVSCKDHETLETPQIPHNLGFERHVARMLQDLGRDNCDLLDGMEKRELEKKFAKLSIDFWESYDPEEVTLSGFPLIGYNNMNVRALCFLCGSAGQEKLVHCCNCCEAYHTFCVSTLKSDLNKKEWWRLDWFCPKCTECRSCFKTGGTQLYCANCQASYHSNCISSGRANVIDGTWMCPSCLHCESCSNPEVHVFVGNLPLCKLCFKLRKKGNFCPLCQVCYDENDYDTKMMECAECKRWIHAKCEQISDEKYQILSFLPSSIEFVCRHCCKSPPAMWTEAVNAQLKVGLLNVIKALSKNKVVCNLLKASPLKKACCCKSYFPKPISLKNLSNPSSETPTMVKGDNEPDKCSDLGLLTPKLTKDDEECLESVNTGIMNLVNAKMVREDAKALPTIYDFTEDVDDLPVTRFEQSKSLNLLSVVGWSGGRNIKTSSNRTTTKSPVNVESDIPDTGCTCDKKDGSQLSIMEIKKKVENYYYSSLKEFNSDMLIALSGIHCDSIKVYQNSLKHVFPWFDLNNPCDTSFVEETPGPILGNQSPTKVTPNTKTDNKSSTQELKINCKWKELLTHEPNYYYVNFNGTDLRTCVFCKGLSEGSPNKEGRLLYCGHNEWVHVNCALWSSEVFEEIDGSLQNVHSAISRSRMIRCFLCGKKGASVGCCARSCPSAYHLTCAMDSRCTFLANKEMYCQTHSHLKGTQELHNPEDFVAARSIYVELDTKRKKEVLHSDVRLAVGSLFIHLIGEIVPEYSDFHEIIVPCNYKCSRLYWSAEEPWKLVRYFIETRLVVPNTSYVAENDINYTIDHSLEITPPPSPLEQDLNLEYLSNRKEIRNLINQLIDAVCTREDDNNLAEQQATDLLPPDIEEAIFKDLPHDILDGISMHDIFTKMNFEDFDNESDIPLGNNLSKKLGKEDKSVDPKRKTGVMNKSVNFRRYGSYDSENKETDHYKWKSSNILQLDGAVDDSSDTDQSMDSSDVHCTPFSKDDEPVTCPRCRRTYRSSIGFQRHLPTCDSDFSSESDSGDEEKEIITEVSEHQNNVESLQLSFEVSETIESLNGCVTSTLTSSDEDSCDSHSERVNVVVNLYQECTNNENALQDDPLPTSPTIIVQPINQEQVIPQFIPAYSQPSALPPAPDIQYFSSTNHNGFPYHPAATVIPAVPPTVVGTIVQSSGVDQIVLNQNPSLDLYSPPSNNIYITNSPMLVGMETVVSNTVMSSSQFIPGVPGMLASSYSATTTQVFHTAKPPIDISQNYVVVNAQPQPVVNHLPPNIPTMLQDGIQSSPWNNYQMNIQESYKVENGCSSYQTVTRKIVHERKDIDGIKTINSQETIVIEPIAQSNSIQPQYPINVDTYFETKQPTFDRTTVPSPKITLPKVVELPRMPTVNKEKPQQAVAPVVIKKVCLPNEPQVASPIVIEKKEAPQKVENKPTIAKTPNKENVDTTANNANCVNCTNVPETPSSPVEANNDVPESKLEVPEEVVEEPKDESRPPPTVIKDKNQEEEGPRITFEITSEDGFSFSTSNLRCAWEKVFDRVQNARQQKGLPPLSKNPFSDPDSMLKKALGLGNNCAKYIVEQLPGASSCSKYKPVYHRQKLSAFEQELSKKPKENYSGSARTERSSLNARTYDMFSWLASRHRRPPKLSICDNDLINGNGRRATSSMSLPMAMRFRHLKETSKLTVGVFRSDIHGRGLFCLRDIDCGEMVIEYAGEVIRSSLTDKRERHYTAKGIGCYMFRIDDQFVVDATMKGNAARFINHSCEPNCYSKVVDILGKKHILIFALRKIIQGEELTYDYKFPLEEDKINCHCLSRRCRKYLN